ncbi:MAG TPA: hypothetical protein VGM30_19820 [Puia sp.]|jgi:hypothetical protein
MVYSTADILLQLDQCAGEFTFPMLDNGYVYPVSSRLTAYRDENRWALIIEVFGFNVRAGGHDGIDNCLHIFGNCLPFEPGTNNSNFLYVTADSGEGPTFDEEYGNTLNPGIGNMLLRGQTIPVSSDPAFYRLRGIEPEDPSNIRIWEYLRAIKDNYEQAFLATEEELRVRIPADLPQAMRLMEWFHPDLAAEEKPSECETFQMIAKVLETGAVSWYRPTLPPTNAWKNWPDGGTL